MSFTDDEVKRLKECPSMPQYISCKDGHYHGDLKALLARLERAEDVISGHILLEQEKINYDEFVLRLNRWRKACGK